MVLEKTLESPLDCKEIRSVHPKGDQSWVFIGSTEAETPLLWPPDAKGWLIWKDPDAGKDWRQEEKGTTEDEMVGWHHHISGHVFESMDMCLSQWTCVWAGSGSWWWTGKPGVLPSMESQRVRHRLRDWTELKHVKQCFGRLIRNTEEFWADLGIWSMNASLGGGGVVAELCLTLGTLSSLPGSSVHGVLQARILEWIAISFSRGSSQPRNRTLVSCISGRFFSNWATREVFFQSGEVLHDPAPESCCFLPALESSSIGSIWWGDGGFGNKSEIKY